MNPERLKLERSSFDYGIGSLLYSHDIKSNLNAVIPDFVEKTYINSNITSYTSPPNEYHLITVRDCIFLSIQTPNDNGIFNCLFNISNTYTFYMTSCAFDKCSFSKPMFCLASRATTISHICCSELTGSEQEDALFMKTDTPQDSFFKFIYSTIFGESNYFKVRGLCEFGGRAALQYQCINISKFIFDKNQGFITRIYASKCITMQMNTFAHLDTQYILNLNIQDGASNERYNHYIGLTNFYKNKQQNAIVLFDMNNDAQAILDQCYFSDIVSDGEKIQKNNDNSQVVISNCMFETYLNIGSSKFVTRNNKEHENFQSHTFAHYTYEEMCKGKYVIPAFGCQNDTCPAGDGCQTFGFTTGDIAYTEKFHPDINTPTPSPTVYFSESAKFSYSSEFTFSEAFSRSSFFTKSACFSGSTEFTNSIKFTETKDFTETSGFSKSNDFTISDSFWPTVDFNHTNTLKPSSAFSPSKSFSKSSQFSKSDVFTATVEFTKTGQFSESSDFTKSNLFSKSNEFQPSKQFSDSFVFSNSNLFSKSDNFKASNVFTQSTIFSSSLAFTQSAVIRGVVPVKDSDDGKKLGTGAIAGIAVGIVAALVIVALLVFFLIKKNKAHINEEEVETLDETQSTTNTDNPIYNKNAEDDPFKDDFND